MSSEIIISVLILTSVGSAYVIGQDLETETEKYGPYRADSPKHHEDAPSQPSSLHHDVTNTTPIYIDPSVLENIFGTSPSREFGEPADVDNKPDFSEITTEDIQGKNGDGFEESKSDSENNGTVKYDVDNRLLPRSDLENHFNNGKGTTKAEDVPEQQFENEDHNEMRSVDDNQITDRGPFEPIPESGYTNISNHSKNVGSYLDKNGGDQNVQVPNLSPTITPGTIDKVQNDTGNRPFEPIPESGHTNIPNHPKNLGSYLDRNGDDQNVQVPDISPTITPGTIDKVQNDTGKGESPIVLGTMYIPNSASVIALSGHVAVLLVLTILLHAL